MEQTVETKYANQAWKESGKTVPFKQFVDELRRSANGTETNGTFIVNRPLNDSVQQGILLMRRKGGYKTAESGKTVLGLNKTLVIGTGVVLVGIAAFAIYKNVRA